MKPARLALIWLLGIAVLVIALGLETRWGTSLRRGWQGVETPAAAPVSVAVLPDFKVDDPIEKMSETTSRTLFTPTRRPAPPAPPPQPPEPPKPSMKKGQFALLGTSIAGDKKTAILREVASGKVHRVGQGAALNELKLTDVKADRVVLTFADDSEVLQLRVATGRAPLPAGVLRALPGGPVIPGAAAVPGQPQVDPAQAATRARRRDIPAAEQPTSAAPAFPTSVPPPTTVAPPVVQAPVNPSGIRFLQPQPEAPSVQAAREAAAAAEWRALEQQIKERQGLVGGR